MQEKAKKGGKKERIRVGDVIQVQGQVEQQEAESLSVHSYDLLIAYSEANPGVISKLHSLFSPAAQVNAW